jgi:hypothetical protein
MSNAATLGLKLHALFTALACNTTLYRSVINVLFGTQHTGAVHVHGDYLAPSTLMCRVLDTHAVDTCVRSLTEVLASEGILNTQFAMDTNHAHIHMLEQKVGLVAEHHPQQPKSVVFDEREKAWVTAKRHTVATATTTPIAAVVAELRANATRLAETDVDIATLACALQADAYAAGSIRGHLPAVFKSQLLGRIAGFPAELCGSPAMLVMLRATKSLRLTTAQQEALALAFSKVVCTGDGDRDDAEWRRVVVDVVGVEGAAELERVGLLPA